MGRTGHSTACYLMDRGQEVVCWDRNVEKLSMIDQNGIIIAGALDGTYRPCCEPVFDKAIAESDYVFVNTVASGHKDIARLCAGKLRAGQRILIFNSNWGVLEFRQILGRELDEKGIILAETGGMHLMTDLPEVGHCVLKKIKKSLGVSAFPAGSVDVVVNELKAVFPQFFSKRSPILTSLDTSNPILHAPIALCGFSKIEQGLDHYFYREGATPHVVSYIEQIDMERLAVMTRMGVRGQSCLEIVNVAWNTSCNNLYDAIHLNYPNSKGPRNIEYRFITEDIPFGIVPIAKLGDLYGVETPYIDTLIDMYCKLMQRNFVMVAPEFSQEDIAQLMPE